MKNRFLTIRECIRLIELSLTLTLILFVFGCKPASIENAATITATKRTITPSPTHQPTSSPTPTPPDKGTATESVPSPTPTQEPFSIIQPPEFDETELNHLSIKCLNLLNEIPENVPESFWIVVSGREDNVSFLFDINSGARIDLEDNPYDRAVSPGGSKFLTLDIDDIGRFEMIIYDNQVNQISVIDHDADYGFISWFDDETLMLYRRPYPNEEASDDILFLYDINSGNRREFTPDLPEISTEVRSLGATWYHRIVLSPTLKYLVYPTSNYDNIDLGDYVLWNIEQNREIARFYKNLIFAYTPVWSPKGDYFIAEVRPYELEWVIPNEIAIPLNIDDGLDYVYGKDLFSMDLNGNVKRLTYITTSAEGKFSFYTFSPDGKKIAMWMYSNILSFYGGEGQQLAVLDLNTGILTNYCVLGNGPIYWSPDGDYLAIGTLHPDPRFRGLWIRNISIVSINEGWVVEIAETAEPTGWLNKNN